MCSQFMLINVNFFNFRTNRRVNSKFTCLKGKNGIIELSELVNMAVNTYPSRPTHEGMIFVIPFICLLPSGLIVDYNNKLNN